MADFHTLPRWKKGATAAEWLAEVSGLALESPEKFGRIVVVAEKLDAEGRAIATRVYPFNMKDNSTIIAALETGKLETWELMKGRS